LIASILVVARNSAVITADLGNRVLSSQFRAMNNLNIPGSAISSARSSSPTRWRCFS
jgi:ABC-type transporter Mla maintaining outer membrane lipid asymmetry permease subunit MlaE